MTITSRLYGRRRLLPFYCLVFRTLVITATDSSSNDDGSGPMDAAEVIDELVNQYRIQTTTLTILMSSMNMYHLDDGANATDAPIDNQTTTKDSSAMRMPFQLEDGILTKADYDTVQEILSKLGLPLSLSGFVLNVLAVIIYARMPPSFVNRYLIGIQFLDALFLLCTLYPFFIILIHGPNAGNTRSYQYYAMYVSNYMYVCFQRTGIFCTAALSVNRCVVMLVPFNQFVKKVFKHPLRIIISTQIIVCITSAYSPFKLKVVHREMPDGSDSYSLALSDAYKSNRGLFDNVMLANSFLFSYIPAISSFIANMCMVAGLIMISRRRKRNTDNPEDKKFFKLGQHKTLLVIVYSGLSLVLLMPFMSVPILKIFVPGFSVLDKEHYMFITMGSISALCDITRSGMGFFVFLGLSRVFRETFVAIILRKDLNNAESQSKTKPTSQ